MPGRSAGARLLLVCLACAAVTAPACRCSDPSSPLVQDFEGRAGLGKWPDDGPGKVERSSDWKADGEASLRIDPGLLGTIERLLRSDFRGADALRVKIHNPSDRLAVIGFELSDELDSLFDRHRSSFGAPPGDSTIDIDLSGDLWRGEENRPYRGPTKTPIDLGHVSRIGFENRGDKPIYVDALTLVSDPLEVPAGAFAFDFGKRGSRVMGKTTGVFEDTVYSAEQKYGFSSGQRGFVEKTMTYPSPLLGDGLAWRDSVFEVELAGGPYLGWVAFERGGFWEDDATGYDEAWLSLNGAVAMKDTFTLAGPHFRFEDVEVTRMAEATEALIWPAHAVHRFAFTAKAGKNAFSLAVPHHSGPPLRVAGLFLAPDSAAGRSFIEALETRQKRSIALAYPESDRARRPAQAALLERPLLVEQRPLGEIAHPRDLPAAPPGEAPSIKAIAGHHAFVQLALYAAKDVEVKVTAEPATDSALREPVISYGVYGPKRPYEGGTAWIETQYYRPLAALDKVRIGPELSRSVVLDFAVPAQAAPGPAKLLLHFTADGKEIAAVPVTVEVFAVELPALPIAVGLFMSALPFGPEAVGDERWWQLQESLLAMQGEAGLNTPSGGVGLDFTMSDAGERYDFTGERALRYLAIAAKHGLDRAVVCYPGFHPPLEHQRPDAARFQRSWAAFEAEHHLPPFYLKAYDEPGTGDELGEVVAYLAPYHAAGVRTIGFLTNAGADPSQKLIDATYAPAMNEHTPGQLKEWLAAGRRVFLYNLGTDRLKMGADLYQTSRAGISGRLEWIGAYTQGFAFNDLDGREPSYGMFVVHDKLGVLPTPRWLAMREGLIDARLQLALERRAPGSGAALWPAEYPASAARWPESALEKARGETLRRLAGSQ